MTIKHTAIVTLKAKPERYASLSEALYSVKTELPLVSGCEGVRVLQHADDAGSYTLVEDWQDEEHHSAHIEGLIKSGVWAQLEAMLREPPISQFLIDIQSAEI